MNADDILSTAKALVGGDRATAHGDKTDTHANIADAWNAILRAKMRNKGYSKLAIEEAQNWLTPLDVANMMEALKIMRRYSGTHNLDDYTDGAGYAGVAGEIAEGEQVV